jgi:hypothetical protein
MKPFAPLGAKGFCYWGAQQRATKLLHISSYHVKCSRKGKHHIVLLPLEWNGA